MREALKKSCGIIKIGPRRQRTQRNSEADVETLTTDVSSQQTTSTSRSRTRSILDLMRGSDVQPLLKEMAAWVDDQDLIKCLPNMTQPPDVLFLVRMHPAQSVSLYTSIVSTVCQGYL